MKKRTTIFFALMLMLALTACSSGNTPAPSAAPAPAPVASAPAPAAPAPSTTPAPTPEAPKEPELSGTMNVVCTSESYVPLFAKFTEATGVKVEFLSMSSGEVLSKIEAEGNSTLDMWFGGGIDAFMSAKEKGYLDQVSFEGLDKFAPEFKDADNLWIAKGLTIAGFIVNDAIMEEKSLPLPATWDDLQNPVYKDELIMSNPAISGTNYAVVNALLQAKGDEGWAHWEAVNENVLYYSRRGSDPLNKTAAGEVAVGITYIDRKVEALAEEQGLTVIYPTDGIPFVPEGVAVFKDSPNNAAAHAFIEWLYTNDENLAMLADIDGKDGIKIIKPEMVGVDLTIDTSILIDVDLSLYGSQRDEILEKWNVMMGDKAEQE